MKTSQTPPIRAVAYIALFAAIFVVLSTVTIPLGFTPVPITLQTFALLLTGAMLGGGFGFLAIAIVVVLTALGFPLLHGAGGLSLILGPTGGFIWMFPVSAYVTGSLVSRIKGNGPVSVSLLAAAMVFGSGLVYLTGVPWYAHVADISVAKAFALVCVPYLPGDLIKVGAAALVTVTVCRLNLLPRLSARDHVVPLE